MESVIKEFDPNAPEPDPLPNIGIAGDELNWPFGIQYGTALHVGIWGPVASDDEFLAVYGPHLERSGEHDELPGVKALIEAKGDLVMNDLYQYGHWNWLKENWNKGRWWFLNINNEDWGGLTTVVEACKELPQEGYDTFEDQNVHADEITKIGYDRSSTVGVQAHAFVFPYGLGRDPELMGDCAPALIVWATDIKEALKIITMFWESEGFHKMTKKEGK